MHIDTDSGEDLGMNLAPMIDVVFLLLIFFMVATTFIEREKELGVELPQAQAGDEGQKHLGEIVINVFVDGTIKINGAVVDERGLVEILERAARTNSETRVTIRGDKEVAYQRVISVLGTCTEKGLLDVGLMTVDG